VQVGDEPRAGLRLSELRQRLRDHGARPLHEERVLRLWTQALPWDSERRRPCDFLPRSLDLAMPAIVAQLDGLARVHLRQGSEDGSERLLIALQDGQTVESVLLPRDGVCVSTQVGCAVGCVFCMTGRSGLLRQLGSAEIVAQVVLARRVRPVRKVVFMGNAPSKAAPGPAGNPFGVRLTRVPPCPRPPSRGPPAPAA